MEVRLYAAGSTILKQGEAGSSCVFVYQGEAKVVLNGNLHLCPLMHHGKQSNAWSAWWGLLEAEGVSLRRPASVFAVHDCTVWYLEGSALKELQEEFPAECGFVKMVLLKHVKLLSQ